MLVFLIKTKSYRGQTLTDPHCKSFYRVTETGWKWLWASITSKRYFKNPVISATFKAGPSNTPTQPYILEEGLGLINQGLSQITQGLAVNM